MADGLARAHSFSFFVRPMQRLCYRSNWFQEILSFAVSLFSTSFIPSFLLSIFLSHSFTPSLSLSLFKERMEDTKRPENRRISEGDGKEERNRVEGRGERRVERRTSSSTFHESSSIFFRYFLSPFIPSVSYHAAAALLRVAPRKESRLSYRLPSDYIRRI